MNCQNCGSRLVSGHLYCDICGAEYRIVPDFEPELEISMAETLSGLSGTFQEDGPTAVLRLRRNRRKKWLPGVGLFLSALLLLCFFYRQSSGYLEKKAQVQAEEKQYLQAAQSYQRLKEKNPETEKYCLLEASMYLQVGDREAAAALGKEALELFPEKIECYDFLVDIWRQDRKYEKISRLLSQFSNEEARQKYREYMTVTPESNYSGGTYEEALEVTLSSPIPGTIFYTLDGAIPDENSLVYQKPVVLGNGQHSLKAIFINSYGVAGEPLSLDFTIQASIPLPPVVEPESGTYRKAGYITLSPEEGTRVFYTVDGTVPGSQSIPYEYPIPMPLGESHFRFMAYSVQGEAGEITDREYLLNIKTGMTTEEARLLLVQELIGRGLLLDKNGALEGFYGVHHYVYTYPIEIEGTHYYVFNEHYLEDELNQRTGKQFAVEVMKGACFGLEQKGDTLFHLVEFTE